MKDLDINIGHNRQHPGPPVGGGDVPFLRARITYPSSLGVARLRSYALVRYPSGSQRNIWPGRPDVSYWRNMARSREIFLLEALASGDVYLNNYSPPSSYGAYATADFPPVAIFCLPRTLSQ